MVVVGMSVVEAVSEYIGAWHACTVTSVNGVAIHTCGAYPIEGFAPALLLVGLLLFPDLGEIAIPGVRLLRLRTRPQEDQAEPDDVGGDRSGAPPLCCYMAAAQEVAGSGPRKGAAPRVPLQNENARMLAAHRRRACRGVGDTGHACSYRGMRPRRPWLARR